MTNFEYMRDRLLRACGVIKNNPVTLDTIRKTQWSVEFERLMRNRLTFGYFRYGPLNNQPKGGFDNIGSIQKRLYKYSQTGNDELLVDIANLCMVEFLNGDHPKKHFKSEDDGEHVRVLKIY